MPQRENVSHSNFSLKQVALTCFVERSSYKRDIQRKRPLLRPIICICNDQNAASLAKLRPHAYLLRFSRPSDVLTVRRLQQICGFEGLKADARALTTLVGV